jgi:hypothetical protein
VSEVRKQKRSIQIQFRFSTFAFLNPPHPNPLPLKGEREISCTESSWLLSFSASRDPRSRLVRADASGGAFNVTLPASADADDWVIVRKKDSSANRVMLKDNAGNDLAWLCAQYDEAMFAFWDGAWTPVRWNIAPLHQVFTTSGTYTKPPLMSRVELFLAGGGGGGGSGRRGAAASARAGGLGGVAGNILLAKLAAADIGSSCTVWVGAGGAGGAAQTVNDSNGNAGGNGGNTSWINLAGTLNARGGSGGAGGTNAAATGGSNSGMTAFYGFSQAGSSSVTGGGGSASASSSGAGSGGAGGGITTGDAAQGGGGAAAEVCCAAPISPAELLARQAATAATAPTPARIPAAQ